MPTISELMTEGLRLHQAGQLAEARQQFEQVLAQNPRFVDAWNLLGLIDYQFGRFAESAEWLRRAIAIDAMQPRLYANLGESLRKLEQFDAAIACYRQALSLNPDAAALHTNLGTLLQQTRQLDAAISEYRLALTLPNPLDARFLLGTALEQQGNLAASALEYEAALQDNPRHFLAALNLAAVYTRLQDLPGRLRAYQLAVGLHPEMPVLHFELGNAFQLLRRHHEAIVAYRRSLLLRPNDGHTLCNLGNAQRELGQHTEALSSLTAAVALSPELAGAHSNLGVVLHELSRLDEARASFERALELQPNRAETHVNLGTLFKDQGDTDRALACFEEALRLQPGYGQALCARGIARLSQGNFAEGLADYEHRIGCPQFDTLSPPGPRWDGSPLAGRRLLIHAEQGFGDTLQFVRYLPRVLQQGATVTLAVQRPLVALLTQSGYPAVVCRDDALPRYDVHIPLLSLPHLFGTTLDSVPDQVPYLKVDPALEARWSEALGQWPGHRVGIVWQGRTNFRGDLLRSIALTKFAPLASVPNVRLLSLQKGPGSEQQAALNGEFEVVDLATSLDLQTPFVDTAAAMKSLDLVITSDTAIAHLAGALGVPVWLATAFVPDWRWMENREDSPWYPTMRLFRQPAPGDWKSVFERMADELRAAPAAF